jgi:V/A-type H+-transporting ATPase subunit C
MVRLSEDPKYGFAIGRVRALETALLDRPRYERLVRAQGSEEFAAALAESVYGRLLEGGTGGVGQLLDSAARENFDFFSAYALDEWLLRLFLLPVAFRDLKTSLKTAASQGTRVATTPKELDAHRQLIDEAAAAVIATFASNPDPAVVDTTLDRLLHRIQLQLASASQFLTGFLGLHADIENLRTFVRLKASGGAEKELAGEMAASFLDGGTLALASLLAALPQPWEAVLDFLAKAPPYGVGDEGFHDLLEAGQAAATGRRSFIRVERLGRERELRYLRQTRYATFGHEPLAAFFLLRENELRNLRLLYAAKLSGLAAADSQELVAYVE